MIKAQSLMNAKVLLYKNHLKIKRHKYLSEDSETVQSNNQQCKWASFTHFDKETKS
jgi:hypothetical protein